MPWMTGLQVAHSVRVAGLATPLVVMTALPIDASLVRSLGAGAVLLRKPFRLVQLLSAIAATRDS
jgi:DNA-binding response OmpR family regulator